MADATDSKKKRRPYAKYAFHNIYNYALMGAVGAVAIVTGTWIPLAIGAGLEAMWMLNAPGSKLLQKTWFDKVHDEKEQAETRARRGELLKLLGPEDVARVGRLQDKQREILKQAEDNPQFTLDLLRSELLKLDKLVDGYIELAVNTTRYEQYLANIAFEDLEEELRRYSRAAEKEEDPQLRRTAKKNLEVLMTRQSKLAELRKYTQGARAQLDLIENTFRLIGDQILTMHSPAELGGQLDELMDGVEAVRSTATEHRQLLGQTS